VWTTRSGVVGLAAAVDTRDCFLLWLPSSRLSGCCRFELGLLRPGRLPVGGLFRLRGRLRDRLRRGFRIWSLNFGGLNNMPPSDDVIPALAQVHLLGRGPDPLSFRSSGVAHGRALSDTLGRSPCKGRLRLFPLNTAAVVRRVVTHAAAALELLPRDTAPTGEVGARTRDTPGRVSAVSLRVTEELAALALQLALWSHRHSQAAEFGDGSHFGHLRPPRHRYNEVGVR
jgi:hypothetical protein